MQQKQNKTETSTKNNSSYGKMMLQKDKKRFQMKEKQAYIQLLKAPRGKEYFQLLGKIKEVANQLADVDEEIEKLQQEIAQEESMLPGAVDAEYIPEGTAAEAKQFQATWAKEDKPDKESIPWMTDTPKESTVAWVTDTEKESTVSGGIGTPKKEEVSWLVEGKNEAGVLQRIEEKKQKILELQREQNRLIEEFQKEQKAFMAQLPVPDKCISMIWNGVNEHILLKYGVIGCPGTAFNSPEELLEITKPRSEQEERQILKGNDAYQMYWQQCGENLLITEIYMDVICVVLMDGNTIVIE